MFVFTSKMKLLAGSLTLVGLVFLLIGYHHLCKRILKQFEQGENTRSHVWYRWFNEAPVVGMLATVILVVVKPFQ